MPAAVVHTHLEIPAAYEQVDLFAPGLLHKLQGSIYVVQLTMAAALYCNLCKAGVGRVGAVVGVRGGAGQWEEWERDN
jgi:hypothetical protein